MSRAFIDCGATIFPPSPVSRDSLRAVLLLCTGLLLLAGRPVHAQETPPDGAQETPPDRPRVIVLTDIGNEPDDAQSLVRFLTYVNEFRVEALIATTSTWQREEVRPDRIRRRIDAYEKVRANLLAHAEGYPPADSLRTLVTVGQEGFGMDAVGPGHETSGSRRIIDVVDRVEEGPIWVLAWGGPNTLAQALWTVRENRPREEVTEFVAKLRVYTISDQDDSGPWMRRHFPELFYIVSPSSLESEDYATATWSGISGDEHYDCCEGADFSLVSNEWLTEHVRTDHGPLGALYPRTEFIMEGDTPSFLHLIPTGLGARINPVYGGWGGRYGLERPGGEPRPIWTDSPDRVRGEDGEWHTGNQATVWRWREAYQHDFAARIDWSNTSVFEEANHPPRPVVDGDRGRDPVRRTAFPDETLTLSAVGTDDPDDDALSYRWWRYAEADTFEGDLTLRGAGTSELSVTFPAAAEDTIVHFILEVTDGGEPSLTRYRRVIVNVRG